MENNDHRYDNVAERPYKPQIEKRAEEYYDKEENSIIKEIRTSEILKTPFRDVSKRKNRCKSKNNKTYHDNYLAEKAQARLKAGSGKMRSGLVLPVGNRKNHQPRNTADYYRINERGHCRHKRSLCGGIFVCRL